MAVDPITVHTRFFLIIIEVIDIHRGQGRKKEKKKKDTKEIIYLSSTKTRSH